MPQPSDHGTLRVRITSIDGSTTHPFQRRAPVRDVHEWSYDKLVRDKSQVSLEATWMEHGGKRIEDESRDLGSFPVSEEREPGREIDLTLNLAWTTQGGDRA